MDAKSDIETMQSLLKVQSLARAGISVCRLRLEQISVYHRVDGSTLIRIEHGKKYLDFVTDADGRQHLVQLLLSSEADADEWSKQHLVPDIEQISKLDDSE